MSTTSTYFTETSQGIQNTAVSTTSTYFTETSWGIQNTAVSTTSTYFTETSWGIQNTSVLTTSTYFTDKSGNSEYICVNNINLLHRQVGEFRIQQCQHHQGCDLKWCNRHPLPLLPHPALILGHTWYILWLIQIQINNYRKQTKTTSTLYRRDGNNLLYKEER